KTNIPVIWPKSNSIRTNERVIWQVPSHISNQIYDQIKSYIPDKIIVNDNTFIPTSMNRRFRFFKTETKKEFKQHVDAACCRINPNTNKYERSFLSVVIYLNDDFTGGELNMEN